MNQKLVAMLPYSVIKSGLRAELLAVNGNEQNNKDRFVGAER